MKASTFCYLSFFTICSYAVSAQALQGPADASRVQPAIEVDPAKRLPSKESLASEPVQKAPPASDPQQTESVPLTVRSVEIVGMTVFPPDHFAPVYREAIGQEIDSSQLWDWAAAITEGYRQAGYFLSRAFVPVQSFKNANACDVRLQVIEGYIAEVQFDTETAPGRLVRAIQTRTTGFQPIRAQELESQLLQLNDLYGIGYNALLMPLKGATDGGVRLQLTEKERQQTQVTVQANNYGSQYLGPYRSSVAVSSSWADYQQTAFNLQAAMPNGEELLQGGVDHAIQLSPNVELSMGYSNTQSELGHTLEDQEIVGDNRLFRLGIAWKPVRQRAKNWTLSADFDYLRTHSDTLGSALVRDRISTFRLNSHYEFLDAYKGFNSLYITLARGLTILNASKAGEPNRSRADAQPDFKKLTFTYSRQNYLGNDWLLSASLSGQWASKALFSAEEYGFGGQAFGRAYDASEITGDNGIAAAVEFNYMSLPRLNKFSVTPYVFYDIGKVWDLGALSNEHQSAASCGVGARISNQEGLSFQCSIAAPLTKSIETPLYRRNGKNPVLRFGLSYQCGL